MHAAIRIRWMDESGPNFVTRERTARLSGVLGEHMDFNRHVGHFGESVVQLIACAGGYTYSKPFPDAGTDWIVSADADFSTYEPTMAIQVKATTLARTNADGSTSIDLEAHDYNRLVRPTTLKRILVAVAIPPAYPSWFVAHNDHLRIERFAFCRNLQGMPPTPNGRSITLRFDDNERFTVLRLNQMLGRIAAGGDP